MPNNPVVASYVADFLKPDQLHVFRQLTGLQQEIEAHVFTHRRENAQRFPYDERWLHVLPKPRTRWWRRLIHTQLRQEPWQMYRWELRNWIQHLTRIEAQVLHIYFGHVAPQFLPLMKAWPHPVVVSFHGADAGLNMDKPHYRAALQKVFQLATKVQSRSEALNEDLLKLGCSPDKLVLQRTGISVESWKFLERPAPADGAWHLMQSCRFIEKKGIDLTLKAFAAVAAQYPKAKLTLVGDGPLRSVLEQQARDLGIGDKVVFAGFLAPVAVREMVSQAHLYLHPSRTGSNGDREGVPNAMLEAMTVGAPVVATRHGGIPEAIVDGESGLLVAEDDAEGLATASLRLLEDDSLRQRLGRGGREAVEQKFSRTVQDQRLIAFYKSLLPAS
jgi:colanic acid/amylovoran biosynthesis glycosyltransferase